jgi:hypothetical protein
LTGRPASPESRNQLQIACIVGIERAAGDPGLAVSGHSGTDHRLLGSRPDDRPTFADIVDRLAAMEWKVTATVDTAKVAKFVKRIEEREKDDASE